MYVPSAPPREAAAAATQGNGGGTAASSETKAGRGGVLTNDPSIWLLVLLFLWALIVHIGLRVDVSVGVKT